MRVRVIRDPDPTSSMVHLAVQRWCNGQWELVLKFPLIEYGKANDLALKLSMSKREPVELAVFEDGMKVEPLKFPMYHVESEAYTCTEQVPENQS